MPGKKKGIDYEETEEHPSFGMVSLSRFSVTPPTPLFGSTVKHGHPIALRICRAERKRTLQKEWFFEGEMIAEVFISSVQLGELLTNMNTAGVPCTIRYSRGGKLEKAERPPENTPAAKTYNALSEKASEASAVVREVQAVLEGLAKKGKPVGKRKLEELAKAACGAAQQIESNMPFVLESFRRDCERVVKDAKGEIEAFISAKVEASGAKALAGSVEIPLLEAGDAESK